MRSARPPLAGLACLLVLALFLAGCGLGAGPAPTAVQLTVTREFGSQVLARGGGALKVDGQETVMSLLLRNYPVVTRFGGGFVQSIDGLAGGHEGGEPVDWFYYVNGVSETRGAAATNVDPGDHIWWDRHDWSQSDGVPAVVGSFPEPFQNGIGGRRLPVRVECSEVSGHACQTVTARLRAVGVPAAIAAIGGGGAPETLRVLVGPWAAVSGAPEASLIEGGPRASGVYATFPANGRTLTLLGPDGQTAATLGSGAGLIAATRHGEDAPLWTITGTDTAGVDRAADDFDQAALADRFALAVSPAGPTPVPVVGR